MSADEPRPGRQRPDRPLAVAATDRPLPLAIRALEDERAPEGMSCLGSYLGPRLVARCVVPPEAAEFLLERGLFERPVRLALAAREAPPGLQCQLYALVELRDEMLEEEEDGKAPWAASVPGAGYDEAVAEGEDAEGEDRQAAVFLGQIVRLDRDRKHPGDLALETVDVLRAIVEGEVSEVVDKVLEDLLGGGPLP
ncbi:MAG: hypothetical protein ACRENB_10885 [Gemmatimonadales bacterium]